MSPAEPAYCTPNHCLFYPEPPYQYLGARCLIGVWRAEQSVLGRVLPAPLELTPENQVISTVCDYPHVTGLGGYHASALFIRSRFKDIEGAFCCHCYMDNDAAVAAGREIWGFPKKLASPKLVTDKDTLIGTLDYGPVRVATGTMGYKHRELDLAEQKRRLERPNFLLKIIPHVDGKTARICELSRNLMIDIDMKGAWTGPASLELAHHALAPVAELPVLEIVEARHIIADLTLGMGEVVFDYLAQ